MQKHLSMFIAMAVVSTGLSVTAAAQSIVTQISFTAPTQGIAVDPLRNKVYVVAPTITGPTDNLAVIDGSSDTLLTNIAVPSGALFVTVDDLNNRIFVAGCNYNLSPSPCTVTVINGKTGHVIKTISVTTTPGFGLTGIVVNPFDRLVYVANGSDNVIDVIQDIGDKDECFGKVVTKIGLQGNSPSAIAINPVLNLLYVPFGSNLTAVVDARFKKIVETTTFGSNTVGAAVNVLTGHVFVTDQESGPSMTGVLDRKGKLLTSVTVDDAPLGVDVDPFTNLVFVASTALDDVDVINGFTNTETAVVTGVPASYLAVNVVTEKVYVSGQLGVTVLTEK